MAFLGNLKIKFKIQISSAFMLILSLVFFAATIILTVSINNQKDQRMIFTEENQQLSDVLAAVENFIDQRITHNELVQIMDKLDIDTQKILEVDSLKKTISRMDQIYIENVKIRDEVFKMTDGSIGQSDLYIQSTVKRLMSPVEQKKVDNLQKMVILSAVDNNKMNANIQAMFLELENNIDTQKEMLDFLDASIANAIKAVKMLKGTPFAQLPVISRDINIKIKEITIQFISNYNELFKLNNEITLRVDNIIKQNSQRDLNQTNSAFDRPKQILYLFSVAMIIIFVFSIILQLFI